MHGRWQVANSRIQVANSRLDEALAALAEVGRSGYEARRAILDRLSAYLLQYPALGGQIVARLCAIDAPSPKDEDLLDLLGAGLDAARIARENGKARGQAFLEATEDALDLARRQGRMTSAHSLLFAQVWTRCALTAPAALEVQLVQLGQVAAPVDVGRVVVEPLGEQLTEQVDGGVHDRLLRGHASLDVVDAGHSRLLSPCDALQGCLDAGERGFDPAERGPRGMMERIPHPPFPANRHLTVTPEPFAVTFDR